MEDNGRVPEGTGLSQAEPGSRLGPTGFDPSRRLEFGPDHKGRFDEMVARFADGMVHVETMSKKGCYVGFYWDDGRYCQWWISSDKKLEYYHEDGNGEPPRFTAWGIDRTPSKLAIAMEAVKPLRRETGSTRKGGSAARRDRPEPSTHQDRDNVK